MRKHVIPKSLEIRDHTRSRRKGLFHQFSNMVYLFCPYCANLLRFQEDPTGNRFACRTCPYIYKIKSAVTTRTFFNEKLEKTVVVNNETAWEGVDSTDERCPKCSYPRAYFKQLQTRSADEGMTLFYRCGNHSCGYTWRVNT